MFKYIFLSLLLLVAPATLADFLTAYQNGDYATAVQEIVPLAEKGDAKAQAWLGTLYLEGKGVTQNDNEARKWFFLAAKQGQAEGQWGLGIMYATGRDVPQDFVKAYSWFDLAANQGNTEGAKFRDMIVSKGLLTPTQIKLAQARTRELQQSGSNIAFELFEQTPKWNPAEKVEREITGLGSNIAQAISKEILKRGVRGTFLEKPFQRTEELKAQKEAIENGKRTLEECIGADNELNQAVLDCMRGE